MSIGVGKDRVQVVAMLRQVRKVVTVVYPTQKVSVVQDADDNKILERALEAKADMIVAFDKDLRDLKTYNGIRIVHPGLTIYVSSKVDSSTEYFKA